MVGSDPILRETSLTKVYLSWNIVQKVESNIGVRI